LIDFSPTRYLKRVETKSPSPSKRREKTVFHFDDKIMMPQVLTQSPLVNGSNNCSISRWQPNKSSPKFAHEKDLIPSSGVNSTNKRDSEMFSPLAEASFSSISKNCIGVEY
jgi:hypothetical protein